MHSPLCYALLSALLTALPVTAQSNATSTLDVVKTVTLPNGQVIDWVRKESQGEIAAPPPPLQAGVASQLSAKYGFDDSTSGPEGTVPILRHSRIAMPKQLPPRASRLHARQNQNKHWYVGTSEAVDNRGGSGSMSMFRPYVQSSGDFSLIQMALVHPSAGPNMPSQSIEAGWINFPDQVSNPHLFTYFTTNDYREDGDCKGGWNTDYKGWVQVDSYVYPGMELWPLSVVGGEQHELQIRYTLHNGGWWLAVNHRWIGYYPAKMFTPKGGDPSATLEYKAREIYWYGEVYQAEAALTTTDMGSGHFAQEGYGRAAYVHNLVYIDTWGYDRMYDGSQGVIVSDPNRYSIDMHWRSSRFWGTSFYLGGPGAGGQIGA